MQQVVAAKDAAGVQRRPLMSARGLRLPARGQGADDVYRYRHLKAGDYDTVVALLHGDVTLSALPTVRPEVIRVFVSCAHTDMETERNILAEEVFPQIRQYCIAKHGVEFHAVDMCWGIPAEAKADHPNAELCLTELSRCQATSTGPNFVILLGQRPDQFHLPAVVAKIHFEHLRAQLVNKGCDVTLVDSCYRQDQNVEPSVYRLQDRDELSERTGLDSVETENQLKTMIEIGVKMADSDLTSEGKLQIFASEIEKEIHQGLIASRPNETATNSILVVREDEVKADDHCPLDSRNKRCSDVRSGVLSAAGEEGGISREEPWSSLTAAAQKRVPAFNCIRCSSEQVPEAIQATKPGDRLTTDMYRTMTALVDRSLQGREPLHSDELYWEVATHWTTVADACRNFVGREVALTKVRQYLTEENTRPYLVQGPAGSGRSALMAQIAASIRSWTCSPAAANPLMTSLVVRFVGASPRMTSVHQLLRSICHQIAFISGQPRQAVPNDYRSLKQRFVEILQRGEVPGLLVVLIDGLELLTPSNGAYRLSWLPATISGNVKIIVSAGTEPAPPGLSERLVNKAGLDNLLRLDPLTVPEAERAVKAMLEAGGRRVTAGQWGRLQDAVRQCASPLFLLLLAQEASRWRSYDVIPEGVFPNTVGTLFLNFLHRLEVAHDPTLVRRSLAYVTAARWGLSEGELLDVLSLDDDVLRAVAARGRSPLPRVPPALWSALYLDLQPLLVVRESDQWPVLWWRHETFARLARGRYLGDVGHFAQIHRTLCDYYLGTWGGGAAKPLAPRTASTQTPDDGRVTAAVRRHVPDMPLAFSGCGGSQRFNLRKMAQLPFSLRNSGQHDGLRSLCLCNYEWLYARLRATSVERVLEDFADFEDRQAALVAGVLRMGGSVLSEDPDRLAAELSGRLLPHIGRFPAIRELLRQCDLAAQTVCPLVPLTQLYPAPGAPLRYQRDLGVRSARDVTVFSCEEEILMTAPSTDYVGLKGWELTQDEPRLDVRLPPGAVYPSQDGRYLALLDSGLSLRLYRTDSGRQHGDGVDLACEGVSCVAAGKRYLAVCPERGVGPVLVDMEEARPAQRFGFHTQVCALSADEGRLAFSNGRRVLLYEFPLLDRQLVGLACDAAQQLALTKRYTKCLVLTKTGMLQSIFFDLVGRSHTTSDIVYDLEMRDFVLSQSENLVLCRAARRLYVINVQARHDKLLHRLQTAPDKVFTDALTTFSGAGFSQDDRLVLASRYVHLFIWDCVSGTLVRMLQAGLSLVVRLFRPAGRNCAVTLLEDGTLQVIQPSVLRTHAQGGNRGDVPKYARFRSSQAW